jgi:hypothetical protein
MENSSDPHKYDWSSVGLDFGNWEVEKLWALELPTEEMNIKDLLWHFDTPFWPNDNSEKWTVTPWDVINQKEGTSLEQQMNDADLTYPIDILKNHGKWLVLDGLHRLAKTYMQGRKNVKVRVVPRERLPEILSGEPIELPE